jgi:hypothetical protein
MPSPLLPITGFTNLYAPSDGFCADAKESNANNNIAQPCENDALDGPIIPGS